MKKFIVFLIGLISINVLSAQAAFLRATNLVVAVKSTSTQEFIWGEPKVVDILIRVEDGKVTIFSKTTQVYRKVSQVSNTPSMSTYFCNDDKGNGCNLSLFTATNSPGSIFVYIEYSDMAWMYETKAD
jgi:hypothetical protein